MIKINKENTVNKIKFGRVWYGTTHLKKGDFPLISFFKFIDSLIY